MNDELLDHDLMVKEHHAKCEESKKKIPVGPWTNEINRLEFKHAGIDCLLVRHDGLLHWCGYAGVPKGHPLFGIGYNDLYDYEKKEGIDISVHGGLTFSDSCHGNICHASDQEVWWFGWDAAHCFDLSPFSVGLRAGIPELANYSSPMDIYRDINYVKKETENLAEQLVLK